MNIYEDKTVGVVDDELWVSVAILVSCHFQHICQYSKRIISSVLIDSLKDVQREQHFPDYDVIIRAPKKKMKNSLCAHFLEHSI